MKEKLIVLLLAEIMIVFTFVACANSSNEDDEVVDTDVVFGDTEFCVDSNTYDASTDKVLEYCTYEEYITMTGEEQEQYFLQFVDVSDFFEWFHSAKAEYESNRDYIEIGENGVIDLDGILGNGGNN